jgi:hypothetical protein
MCFADEKKCCYGSCWADGCCPPRYDCPEDKPDIECHCINMGKVVNCMEINISNTKYYTETITNEGAVMEFRSNDRFSLLRCIKK